MVATTYNHIPQAGDVALNWDLCALNMNYICHLCWRMIQQYGDCSCHNGPFLMYEKRVQNSLSSTYLHLHDQFCQVTWEYPGPDISKYGLIRPWQHLRKATKVSCPKYPPNVPPVSFSGLALGATRRHITHVLFSLSLIFHASPGTLTPCSTLSTLSSPLFIDPAPRNSTLFWFPHVPLSLLPLLNFKHGYTGPSSVPHHLPVVYGCKLLQSWFEVSNSTTVTFLFNSVTMTRVHGRCKWRQTTWLTRWVFT